MRFSKNSLRRGLPVAFLIAVAIPVLSAGDTVRLLDGSTLKGRVLRVSADSLLLKTTFGSEVRIPRVQLQAVFFGDSVTTGSMLETRIQDPSAGGTATDDEGGQGRLVVTFADRSVSSKIVIVKKQRVEELTRANYLVQAVLVDGHPVSTRIDTTTDKTIYKGPERILKNSIDLEDVDAIVPAGVHQVTVLLYSAGYQEYAGDFDGKPVYLELIVDEVTVRKDTQARIRVGIGRGKLRLKEPQFIRVE